MEWNLEICSDIRWRHPWWRNRHFKILTIWRKNGLIGGLSSKKGIDSNWVKMISYCSQMFTLWGGNTFMILPIMYKILETKLDENLRKKAKISRFIRIFYRFIPKQTLETYRKELDLTQLISANNSKTFPSILNSSLFC